MVAPSRATPGARVVDRCIPNPRPRCAPASSPRPPPPAFAGDGERHSLRLMTFSRGTLFGEMALLDREPRLATVVADTPLVCYALSREAFERLVDAHPAIGRVMLANLARELSLRMRRANRTLASVG